MPNRLTSHPAPSATPNAPELAPELSPYEVPLYLHHAFHALVQVVAAFVFGGAQ